MSELGAQTNCPITDYVINVFEHLARAGIPHCLLRNIEFLTQGLPYTNTDLDVLVRSEDLGRIQAILLDCGFVRTRQSTVSLHIGYVAYLATEGRTLALDLHLNHPSWNDIPYGQGDLVLRDAVGSDPPIPGDAQMAALLVLHSILDKKSFKWEYIEILNRLLRAGLDPDRVRSIFEGILRRPLADRMVALLSGRDYAGLLSLRPKVIRSLLGLRPVAWANLCACLWRSRLRQVRKRLFPPALLVALIGPDGAGKSTLGTHLNDRLQACGIPVRRFYMGRWHSHILPLAGLARSYGVSSTGPQEVTDLSHAYADPPKVKGRRRIYRLFRDVVYVAEMSLRYLLRIRPALHKGGVVLTDRYAFDLLLDPNVTDLTRLVLSGLFPRPHLCFYLHNSAEALRRRKAEQSLDEIQRQLDIFASYQERLGFIPTLSNHLEETIHKISERTVLEYFKRV